MTHTISQNGIPAEKLNGLEGPFRYPNGVELYFDPQKNMYVDPVTGRYPSTEEIKHLHRLTFEEIERQMFGRPFNGF